MNRSQLIDLAWKTTHRDYRWVATDGARCVMVSGPSGSTFKRLDHFEDSELRERIGETALAAAEAKRAKRNAASRGRAEAMRSVGMTRTRSGAWE